MIVLFAANGYEVPLLASSEARPGDQAPLTLAKMPPMITRELSGDTVMVLTVESALGAQASVAPVVGLTAASRERATPFTEVNQPPAYTALLVTARANTSEPKTGAKELTSEPS